MPLKIKELPEGERPYEKLEQFGAQSLSNAELLAIIIKTGTKEETSIDLANKILKLNSGNEEGISFLKNITIEELIQIKGIGKVKAIQIKAASELALRISRPENYKKIKIKAPYDVAKIFMQELRFETKEAIKTVILNNKNEILKIQSIAIGGSNFANLEVKEFLTEPVKMGAPKLILIHNHPSGDSTPSKQDICLTEKLYEITQMMGIELVDHLVIGNMEYTSIFSLMVEQNKTKRT